MRMRCEPATVGLGLARRVGARAGAALLALTALTGCALVNPRAAPTPSSSDVVGENGGVQHSAPGNPAVPTLMPPDLAPAPNAPCAQVKRPAGWLAAENTLPGNPAWRAASS